MQILQDYNKAFVQAGELINYVDGDAIANGTFLPAAQPDLPRNVVLTITDGDASIDAFTITVNGTDLQDKTVSEAFIFSGGLTQTGTQTFKTITNIVVTSLNGAGVGDTFVIASGWYIQLTKGNSTLISIVSTQTSCGPISILDDYDVNTNGAAYLKADLVGTFDYNISLARGLRVGMNGTTPYTIIYKQ